MQSTCTVWKTIHSLEVLVLFKCTATLTLLTPNFPPGFHTSIMHSSEESRSPATIPAGYTLHLLPAECPAQAEVQRAENRDAIQTALCMSIKVCA